MEQNEAVRANYDADPLKEWERMTRHPFEFGVNLHYIRRYVKPGDRVLDVGGGPGRYSMELAAMGCDVTLVDLSPENVRFAQAKAQELGLPLRAMADDARTLDCVAGETFDHVLCMGPLYHLWDETERAAVVRACMAHLRPGGMFIAAFIAISGGVFWMGRNDPACILHPEELEPLESFYRNESWSGVTFTRTHFATPDAARAFMRGFGMTELHFLASEPIVCAFEDRIKDAGDETVAAWLQLALRICEDARWWNTTEHLLWVGRKEAAIC